MGARILCPTEESTGLKMDKKEEVKKETPQLEVKKPSFAEAADGKPETPKPQPVVIVDEVKQN